MAERKVVIFDMDGVLFDTELRFMRCFETVAGEYHMPDAGKVCLRCIGVNAVRSREIFREHYGDAFPLEEIRQKVDDLFRHTNETKGMPLKPYAEDILRQLKKDGYELAVASSTKTETVIRELKLGGLHLYFDLIVGGDMVSRSKPNPDIFLKACELLGCEPCRAYVIEDSVNGLRAARAAGAMPIAVPDLIPIPEEVRAICHGIFHDLSEVMAFFRDNAF